MTKEELLDLVVARAKEISGVIAPKLSSADIDESALLILADLAIDDAFLFTHRNELPEDAITPLAKMTLADYISHTAGLNEVQAGNIKSVSMGDTSVTFEDETAKALVNKIKTEGTTALVCFRKFKWQL